MKKTNVKCSCPDWKPNMEKLNAPNLFLHARNSETYKGYEGKIFIYCPWCGKELKEEK